MIYDLTYIRARSGFEEIEEFFLWMLSCQALNNMSCVNTNGNTMLSEEQEVSLRIIFDVRDVGLDVAESRTGNHPKDDFTPLETIQRLCGVFGRRSHLGFEGESSMPNGRTILDAPPGYIGLYTHCFSLTNLRFPLNHFFCKENMLDVKSFKDKLHSSIEQNPQFQRLARYP
nr:hypothetical protein [Tanacetum cinerariifolium]